MESKSTTRRRLKSWGLRGKEPLIVEYRDQKKLTFEEIAVLMGASQQGVYKAYKRSTERIIYIGDKAFHGTVHFLNDGSDFAFHLHVQEGHYTRHTATLEDAWIKFEQYIEKIKELWKP